MKILSTIALLLIATLLMSAPATAADGWIAVEVVMERSVQATSQREWLEALTAAGADDVRLRSSHAGDEPTLESTGTDDRPRYRLVGVLDGRGVLTLPGGRFDLRSRAKLRDYLNRLGSDGAEGVTAPTGAYGLTEKQTHAVTADLMLPMGDKTAGKSLVDVVKQADRITELRVKMDDAAWQVVRAAEPVTDEVETLTVGTALALLLKRDGLVLVPTKERGEDVVLRVARAVDVAGETWPVGWKPSRTPGQLAPELQKMLTAEVANFTLAEAMESITPRVGLGVYWDHAVLAEHQIDPTEIQVKFDRRRTRLLSVMNQLLFQARLRGELKVDEAGTGLYWISR